MRVHHRITIARAMEVIAIDPWGRLFYRQKNGSNLAGDVARYRVKKNRPHLMIDGISIPATKVAWMIQLKEYPPVIPMTRNHSRDDFVVSNLTLNVDDLIWVMA